MNSKVKPSNSALDGSVVNLYFATNQDALEWYRNSEFAPKFNFYNLKVVPYSSANGSFEDNTTGPDEFRNGRSMIERQLVGKIELLDVVDGVYVLHCNPDSMPNVASGFVLRSMGGQQSIVVQHAVFRQPNSYFGLWVREGVGYLFDLKDPEASNTLNSFKDVSAVQAYDGWYRVRYMKRNESQIVACSSFSGGGPGFVVPSPIHAEGEGWAFKFGREFHLILNQMHMHVPLVGDYTFELPEDLHARITSYSTGMYLPSAQYVFQEKCYDMTNVGIRPFSPAPLGFCEVGGKVKIFTLCGFNENVHWKFNGSSFTNTSSW